MGETAKMIRDDCRGCFVKREPPVECEIINAGLFNECPCKVCIVKGVCFIPNNNCDSFNDICDKVQRKLGIKNEAKTSDETCTLIYKR